MTDLRDHLRNALHDAVCPLPCDSMTMGYLIRQADALLPIIAAHEAEVVGSVLDRIDALHPRIANQVPNFSITVHLCGADRYFFPCPTRRLTAKIRGEMSND